MMSEEAKEVAREYKREWRRKNKDKIKASNERYWEKRAQLKKETLHNAVHRETCTQCD